MREIYVFKSFVLLFWWGINWQKLVFAPPQLAGGEGLKLPTAKCNNTSDGTPTWPLEVLVISCTVSRTARHKGSTSPASEWNGTS